MKLNFSETAFYRKQLNSSFNSFEDLSIIHFLLPQSWLPIGR